MSLPPRRSTPRGLAIAAAFLLVVGCADPRPELLPMPAPDVAQFEPSVRDAITRARAEFDRIAATNPKNAVLGAAYGELALTYHAQDLVAPAERGYQNARRLAPREKRWPYLQGHLYNDASRMPEAIAAFEAALAIDGNDPATLSSLGMVLLQSGDPDRAKTFYEKLRADDKTRAVALAGLGKVALAQRDFRAAVDAFEEALKLAPGATRLRQPLAMAWQGLGDREKAEANLAQFSVDGAEPLVDDPAADALGDHVAASRVLLRRGQRAGKAGRFDAAEVAFRKAVEADPKNAEALANLGVSLANLGRNEEAQKRLAESIAIEPANALAQVSLGVVLDRQGNDLGAAERYEAALNLDPENQQARVYLADAKMRTGHPLDAAADYRKALERAPGTSRFVMSLALAELKGGRVADARRTIEAGLAAQPRNGLLANALARILATAADASVRDAPRALEIAQSVFKAAQVPDVGETYAMALAATGAWEDATKLQQETIVAFERMGVSGRGAFLLRNLALYQQRKPAREAWAADDPIFMPRSPAAKLVQAAAPTR